MWNERFACWVPSYGETHEDAREVIVSYSNDSDPTYCARIAAERYAGHIFQNYDPFRSLDVRVRSERGTFDVHVDVEPVPDFHAARPIRVEEDAVP